MVIYKISNKINDKLYIGQTSKTIEERFKEHCKINPRCIITLAIKKHGKKNFSIEIIEECPSIEDTNEREKYWIKYYDSLSPNGYNLTTGGYHCKMSLETRIKIGKASKGRKVSEETRRRLSQSGKGKHFRKLTKEHRQKVSDALKGHKTSEETKRKMREVNARRRCSDQTKEKMRQARLAFHRRKRLAAEYSTG